MILFARGRCCHRPLYFTNAKPLLEFFSNNDLFLSYFARGRCCHRPPYFTNAPRSELENPSHLCFARRTLPRKTSSLLASHKGQP